MESCSSTTFSTTTITMATKLAGWEALTHKVTWPLDHMIFWHHLTNIKDVFTTAVLWWPNLPGWWFTLRGSYMWSFKILWQTKTLSPLTQHLWPSKLAGWRLILRDLMVWTHRRMGSCGKLKLSNLPYWNIYSHQTCQCCDRLSFAGDLWVANSARWWLAMRLQPLK